jgi:hypothetical protein
MQSWHGSWGYVNFCRESISWQSRAVMRGLSVTVSILKNMLLTDYWNLDNACLRIKPCEMMEGLRENTPLRASSGQRAYHHDGGI